MVGVDPGVNALATLSNGETIIGPKVLGRHLRRLRRLSRGVSRKERGSKSRAKARTKLARLHARIAGIHLEAPTLRAW